MATLFQPGKVQIYHIQEGDQMQLYFSIIAQNPLNANKNTKANNLKFSVSSNPQFT